MLTLVLVLTVAAAGFQMADRPSQPPERTLEQIRAYVQISDRLSTSGQITDEQIPLLREAGFEVVINLAVADDKRNSREGHLVAEQGLVYLHIPVVWESPQQRDLELFFDAMDAYRGRKVLVHCFANMRASTFTYLYRTIRLKEPEAAARTDLEEVWDPASQPQWDELVRSARANPALDPRPSVP